MASLTRFEGYLLVDHSSGPGLTEEQARACGYTHDFHLLRGGKQFEAATITCHHCGMGYIKNPERVRPRAHCRPCDHYICDFCDIERNEPGYVHMPFKQKADLIMNLSLHGETLGSPLELVAPISIVVP